MAVLSTGAAVIDITPSVPMANYNGTEIEPGPEQTNLYVQVIYCTDGCEEIAFISADLSFIDRPLVLRIRDECHRRLGLNPNRLFISATHTHNAPAVCPTFLTGGRADPLYLDFMVDRMFQGVDQARRRKQPAALRVGTVSAPGYLGNRRRLRPDGGIQLIDSSEQWHDALPAEGPVDDLVSFIAFDDLQGKPLAFMINLACHNNCCDTFGGGSYHKDFFGRIADALHKKYSTAGAVLCVPAPSGNVLWKSPAGVKYNEQDQLACEIGSFYADTIAAVYEKLPRESDPNLKTAGEVLVIEDRPLSESTFCEDGCRGESPWELEFARLRYDPEKEALEKHGTRSCLVEIRAVQIGSAALVSNPAELFVEYGLEIKRESPYPVTLILELTNGYCGYVPTESSFNRGGYETHRTVYTSRLDKRAGRMITDTSLRLLKQLQGAN